MSDRSALWSNRDFLRLWGAQAVSLFGSVITRDALPLAAILVLAATPFEVGVLAAAGALASVAIGLPAGAWIDRARRRPVMIASDVARAVLLVSIPLAFAFDALTLAHLIAVAAISGVFTLLFDVSDQSYLPTVVEPDQLVEGNSKLGLSASVAEVGGSAAAGILVQLLTAPIALLVDAVTFAFSAVTLSRIRRPEPTPVPHTGTRLRVEVFEGLRTTRSHPRLGPLLACNTAVAGFGGFFGALYALFVLRELGLGPATLGLLIASGGIGAAAGAALAPRIHGRYGSVKTLVRGLGVCAGASFLIPLAGGAPWLAIAMLGLHQVVGDAGLILFTLNGVTLQQSECPSELRARVAAAFRVFPAAAGLVGLLLGGALGGWLGLRPTLAAGAIGFAATAVYAAARLPRDR